MTIRTSLLGGAALGALLAVALVPTADAKTVRHHHHAHKVAAEGTAVRGEVDELKAEVDALKSRADQQSADQAQTQTQLQQLQGQLADANARAARAEEQVQTQIETIPGDVQQEVARAKPKTDKIYYKGITLTLGGFAAAEGVWRSRNEESDIGSQYQKIPYLNSPLAHTPEIRGTARQSRISFLAQGAVTPTTIASFYGEFDFLGGAQTANSNESNSFQPRVRNLYATVDWNDSGWHLLAGQSWSLVTMNGKGITPRDEVIPPTIDAQYVPGFVWARQPQVRVTKDLDDKQVWLAVSAENPQTTLASAATGTGTTFSGVTVTDNAAGIGEFDGNNTLSLNHIPDFVGKIAFEPIIGGAQPLHLEVFGIASEYTDRVNVVATAGNQAGAVGLVSGNSNNTSWGGGFGGGVTATVVPHLLDLQANAITGSGIGRYGAGQLPDVVVGPSGNLVAIPETMFMAGATLHATHWLDIYVMGGMESESSVVYNGTLHGSAVHLGYGNTFATLGNCSVELASCSPDTKSIDQITVGLWDKLFTGSFGQVRWGLQYSHTDLHAFSGIAGANGAGLPVGSVVKPITNDDMVLTSFRYYPF